ncbi:MAG: hypothetical protein ACREEM_37525 [Blastocatellia bacterium]
MFQYNYAMTELTLEQQEIVSALIALSPDKQSTVREFIRRLEELDAKPDESPFLAAIDEFIAEHPELLRRLAQ